MMIVVKLLILINFFDFCFAKFEEPLPTKDNIREYLSRQYSKNGEMPEKYDGPVYDDMNVVISNVDPNPLNSDANDTASDFEDEPRLFTFDPQEAPRFRGKRQSGFQPSAPVRSASTGAAIVAHVDSTSDIVPYDAHIDPDFPAEAPVARGLKNIPEGWNLDKEIDYEFQRGFRKASSGASNPSYGGGRQRSYSNGGGSGMENVGITETQGPYFDSGMGAGYGSGMSSGYGSMGSSSSPYGSYGGMSNGLGYGSSAGYGGLGQGYGGYGSSGGLGGYGSSSGGYGGLGQSYGGLGQGYGGYGSSGGFGGLGYGGYGK